MKGDVVALDFDAVDPTEETGPSLGEAKVGEAIRVGSSDDRLELLIR